MSKDRRKKVKEAAQRAAGRSKRMDPKEQLDDAKENLRIARARVAQARQDSDKKVVASRVQHCQDQIKAWQADIEVILGKEAAALKELPELEKSLRRAEQRYARLKNGTRIEKLVTLLSLMKETKAALEAQTTEQGAG